MATVTRYNANECSVSVNGFYITQLGESMVSWSKDEAYSERSVGALGDVVISEINNKIHTLTLTVQATSPQLKELFALAGSSELVPVWVSNESMGVSFGGEKAYIEEAPEISFGTTAEDFEFTFVVIDGVTDVG